MRFGDHQSAEFGERLGLDPPGKKDMDQTENLLIDVGDKHCVILRSEECIQPSFSLTDGCGISQLTRQVRDCYCVGRVGQTDFYFQRLHDWQVCGLLPGESALFLRSIWKCNGYEDFICGELKGNLLIGCIGSPCAIFLCQEDLFSVYFAGVLLKRVVRRQGGRKMHHAFFNALDIDGRGWLIEQG